MHTQFTIFKKGLALIAVPLLVQAVFIAVLVKAQADRDRAQEWAVHTKEVFAKVEELHRTLIEGYAGVRGLIVAGAPAVAPPDEAVLKRVPAQVEALRELVSDNDRQAPRIARIASLSDTFLRWIADEDRLIRSARGIGRRPRSAGVYGSSTTCGRPSTNSAARRSRWTASGWSASERPRRGWSGRSSAGARRSWPRP